MARIPRGVRGPGTFHILNRQNDRSTVFHQRGDYGRCVDLLDEGLKDSGVRPYAFCLMPNHFHLVAKVDDPRALSRFMQWWMTAYVRGHNKFYGRSGHVWQGRFKSFPIQEDEHLLTVLRYVLLNPVRAGLVAEADAWAWSSLRFGGLMAPWPVQPPGPLASWLRDGLSPFELAEVRECIVRRAPFGSEEWRQRIAKEAGLEKTLRPRGRPQSRFRAAKTQIALADPPELTLEEANQASCQPAPSLSPFSSK